MAQTVSMVPSQPTTADFEWIAAELEKSMEAERTLSSEAKARGDSPPESALAVLYNEISAADERHVAVIESIATRYGRTPGPASAGIGQAFGLIKDRFAKMGRSPLNEISSDLEAKARVIHWYKAWVLTLEAIGDKASARELSVVLTEEETHRDALQQAFNRMVAQYARGDADGQREVSTSRLDRPAT